MAIFVTGTTGYLGSYVAAGLFTEHRDKLIWFARRRGEARAVVTSLQLHFQFREFALPLFPRANLCGI
jgi:thioester reductase-like protein